MAFDIKKIKEKLAKLNDRTGGKGKTVTYWKPLENVDTTIRIVPTEDGDPLKEFYFHYLREDAKKVTSIFCLKRNLSESCPICDLVSKLYKEGDEESRTMAKEISSKQRFFAPVIARGEEDKGVMVWGFSKTIYEELLKLMLNPDYGDITDVTEGLDLTVQSTKKGGKKFAEAVMTPKRKSTPLAQTKKEIEDFLSHGLDFNAIFERKTTGQVAEALDKFLNGGSEEGGDVSTAASGEAEELDSALKSLGV